MAEIEIFILLPWQLIYPSNHTQKLFIKSTVTSSARSKFWGVLGSEDKGGGDNSIQFINIGRVGDTKF